MGGPKRNSVFTYSIHTNVQYMLQSYICTVYTVYAYVHTEVGPLVKTTCSK